MRLDIRADKLQKGDVTLGSHRRIDGVWIVKDPEWKGQGRRVRVDSTTIRGISRTGYWNPSTVIAVERSYQPSVAEQVLAQAQDTGTPEEVEMARGWAGR